MRILAILCVALAAGCAEAPQDHRLPVPPPTDAGEARAPLGNPPPSQPPERPEAALPAAAQPSKPAAPPSAKAVAKVTPPPAIVKSAAPLDVDALKARLKDTDGIGVFAKLALKNQMDDLLKQLRAAHAGKGSAAPLRPLYDSLIAKAVSVLRDGDPGLAGTIARSREAIWDLLADPVKFDEAS